jgi:hypothetical protein
MNLVLVLAFCLRWDGSWAQCAIKGSEESLLGTGQGEGTATSDVQSVIFSSLACRFLISRPSLDAQIL